MSCRFELSLPFIINPFIVISFTSPRMIRPFPHLPGRLWFVTEEDRHGGRQVHPGAFQPSQQTFMSQLLTDVNMT